MKTIERLYHRNKNLKLIKQLAKIYQYQCAICNWHIDCYQHLRGCEFHHIIPVKEGGLTTINNLILLCPNCHKEADYGLLKRDFLISKLKFTETIGDTVNRLKVEYRKLNK